MADDFSDYLYTKFLKWEKQWQKENKTRKRRSYAEFAKYLGVYPALLNNWMNQGNIPSQQNVNKVAHKLGPDVYDILDLPRPDPLLTYITNNWVELSPEIQHQIKETIDEYLNGHSDDKIAPEADPA